jgi:hypothetical protein
MKELFQTDFIKNSGILFLANILIGALNYGIIFYIARSTNILSEWSAVAGTVTILLTIIGSFGNYFAKIISIKAETSKEVAFSYKNAMLNMILANKILLFIIIALSSIVIGFFSKLNYIEIILLSVFLSIEVFISLNLQFIIGLTDSKNTAKVLLTYAFTKFFFALASLVLGFGVYSYFIGLTVGAVITYIVVNNIVKSFESRHTYKETIKHNLLNDFIPSLQTVFGLTFLMLIWYVFPIVSNQVLPTLEKDLFASIFIFAQILNFVSLSLLSFFLVTASVSKNLRLYFVTLAIIAGISLCSIFGFKLFDSFLLYILNKTQYLKYSYEFFNFGIATFFYNLLFVSLQFLISRRWYNGLKYNYIFAGIGLLGLLSYKLNEINHLINFAIFFFASQFIITIINITIKQREFDVLSK